MNLLTKTTPYGRGDAGTVGVVVFDINDFGDLGVELERTASVCDGSGKYHHVRERFMVRPDELVQVHAALGRAIDARLHAEASKSVNPKE